MIAKLIWTLILVALAYFAFRGLRGMGTRRRDSVEEAARRATEAQCAKQLGEEMRECPVCKTYRPVSDAEPCSRKDCPIGTGKAF